LRAVKVVCEIAGLTLGEGACPAAFSETFSDIYLIDVMIDGEPNIWDKPV